LGELASTCWSNDLPVAKMGACSGDRGDASIAGRISEGFFFC